MKKNEKKEKNEGERDSASRADLLRSISFLASSGLVIIFVVSYGYLEYYYIDDPIQGKTANLTVKGDRHRVAIPLIGGLYSYHIFPMIVILFW